MLLIEAERRSPTTTYYQGAGQRGTVSSASANIETILKSGERNRTIVQPTWIVTHLK